MGKQTMISINLTPMEELENPLWYIPDLISLVVVLAISLFSIQFYLDEQETQVEALREQAEDHRTKMRQIQGEVSQFNELNQKITKLESKKSSLLRITDSKLMRYLPVILIENLQNLKPKGLWFTKVAFLDQDGVASLNDANPAPGQNNFNQQGNTNNNANNQQTNNQDVIGTKDLRISIEGAAFNKIIIAEFMTALKATQNQDFDAQDVRSQIYFDDVSIAFAESRTIDREEGTNYDISQFRLILTFKERSSTDAVDLRLSRFIDKLQQTATRR